MRTSRACATAALAPRRDGAIPHRGIGNHCRLQLEDVVSYKTRVDQEREVVLDELASEAQEQGHGY